MRNSMHENAVNKMRGLVVGLLKNFSINNGRGDWASINTPADSIGKELVKHKSDYVKEIDVYSILLELLGTFIHEQPDISNEGFGPLQELIGEERLLQLAGKITAYLCGIPHKVTAELSLAPLTSSIEKQRYLAPATQAGFKNPIHLGTQLGRGFGLLRIPQQKNFFIEVSTMGAACWGIESTTNRALVSSIKILLHHAIDRSLIKVPQHRYSLARTAADSHQIDKIIIYTTENAIWPRENTIDLPLEICILLGKLIATEVSEEAIDKFLASLEAPAKLIESGQEECTRIKAAIEWSFDSLTAENETMAFLKACIGLEALLGENEAGPSLTEALSDRCAYLIATSIKGRKGIKERFKELYKLRSKIVHGSINHLDRENLIQLEFAKHFLRSAIRKELQYALPQPN